MFVWFFMRDIDVRISLRQILLRRFDHDSVILEEMVVPSCDARIDLAVINGEMHGFEIKSDSDNLKRLPTQCGAYQMLFDRLTVVVGERHVAGVRAMVPTWWGIGLATRAAGGVEISQEREARENPHVSIRTLVGLLRRPEIVGLLNIKGLGEGSRNLYLFDLIDALVESSPPEDLKEDVRNCLKRRENWRLEAQRT
jgi:hypothetical protein